MLFVLISVSIVVTYIVTLVITHLPYPPTPTSKTTFGADIVLT